MAHKRKDTFVPVMEWAKHLKPYGKRIQAKAERRAAAKAIADSYPKGECPDCQWKIRSNVREGSACPNCGHVFYSEA
jgi:acetone carboxylase gamma subunit